MSYITALLERTEKQLIVKTSTAEAARRVGL